MTPSSGSYLRLLGALAFLIGVAGCMWLELVLRPKLWDDYPDSGPIQVYGADPATAGQRIYNTLKEEDDLKTFLAGHPEPDTIEVLGGRYTPKRFALVFKRAGLAKCSKVVIDPTRGGWVPRPLESCLVTRPTRTPHRPSDQPTPTPRRTPSPEDMVDCPIAPTRPDCRAFCVGGATYEWCVTGGGSKH